MKKLLAIALCLSMLLSFGLAEDYSAYTKEELEVKRQELIQELSLISSAYGAMVKTELLSDSSGESLGSIQSLFPDEDFAMFIRDKLQKFSISQPVTQDELDTIKSVNLGGFGNYQAANLTGIHYLRNLKTLDLSWQSKCTVIPDEVCELAYLSEIDIDYSSFTSLPESIGNCSNLSSIKACSSDLRSLPESITNLVNLQTLDLEQNKSLSSLPNEIGNLVNLKTLNMHSTGLNALPDSICNCTNLTSLNISYSNVSSLPDNIGNLVNLNSLNISHTNISTLPESIWGLTLKTLDMSGTSIK